MSFLKIIHGFSQVPQFYNITRQLSVNALFIKYSPVKESKPLSPRMQEFKKKLRETATIDKLEELSEHPFQEKEPLKPFPDNTNPETGEVGGPIGPEPTRYGDWERKGKVSDF
ncbi:hypothetical protein Zmor_013831 [Zophobas morio]|uniref:Succinate dehydrogenase assembly factor 4, mitochondrial n=1 Tax=Zophobas morio TaxID=2755281 RepID=A0AA38III8_9CUCU|nr:hypothetical protein Zmor_013831 [Zophobas morio]